MSPKPMSLISLIGLISPLGPICPTKKRMKKKLIILTLAALALTACTNESFMGSTAENNSMDYQPIEFVAGSNRQNTRADLTGAEAASVLSNFFHVYGVKTVDGADRNVFPNYVVEYDGTDGAGAANSTASNTTGWEYVGLNNHTNQTLHYWDYSASNFTFQAWSPSTGNTQVEVTGKNTLTVTTTTADELAQLYIADLVSIDRSTAPDALNHYGGVVTFTFRSMATKVRLGIYESVPGYSVSNVTFRSYDGRFINSNTNALLDGSFNGSDLTGGGIYYVTYNALTNRAELDNNATAIPANYYDFGTFSQEVIGTESSDPTWAGGTPDFHFALPNEDNTGDMTLYVDFTLTAEDGSNDVINVTGAHVTVPASFMVWHPNYAYTYLFHITQDVNGTTGEEGVDPEKLYPITFDAQVAEYIEVLPVVEVELKD